METDYKFTEGKYRDELLSEIYDLDYIQYYYDNNLLSENDKLIFIKRIEYLSESTYCESCSC